MKILISGICGFAGTSIAKVLLQSHSNLQIMGLDNFSRKGSELNTPQLSDFGINLIRGDIRSQSDIDALPKADWVIDCAANPSVLAGLDGQSSSRQLMAHNLLGTINLLEYCKSHKAGLILLSTSRVYSASELAALPVQSSEDRFELQDCDVRGASSFGISEDFPTTAPLSLYGASKLASETLILEYGECFDFPVWINRSGVLAGAGQFGKADQGIFSFWIHSFREKKPVKYIGFNGKGHQVRDALHPKDLVALLSRQMLEPDWEAPKIINLGGGFQSSMSLKELSNMDSTTAQNAWNWNVQTKIEEILEEIANHAEKNPYWLSLTN